MLRYPSAGGSNARGYLLAEDIIMANHIDRIPLRGYRVVARHRDHRESLVTLAENARQAAFMAKAFCEALEVSGRRDGIVSVRTEE